jgi:predicted transport protein
MPIFVDSNGRLNKVTEVPFALEKEMQKLVEDNLQVVFRLEKVKSEFPLNGLRIDTLAFDPEVNAFVIIEYKRDKNFSVIDQGFAYLSLMLNNKADFILEYNENAKSPLKKDQLDWSQSRVVFVAPTFTNYQQQAINFKDLPIELWELTRYNNHLILFNQLRSPDSSESIKKISKENALVQKVSDEVKVYTEEDHLISASEPVEALYQEIKSALLAFGDDVQVKPKKVYIAFTASSNFVDITIQKKQLKCWLNLKVGELKDPFGLAKDVSNIGHYGNGDYEINIDRGDLINDFVALAKQAYLRNGSL